MSRARSLLFAVAGLTSCADGAPSSLLDPEPMVAAALAATGKVTVCHQPERGARLLEVASQALAAHLREGDYLARLVVEPGHPTLGDGIHFGRLTDAIAAARAIRMAQGERESAACRITIEVASGTFEGSLDPTSDPVLEHFPLVIDVPELTLRGALHMSVDAQGRATGAERWAGELTTLRPDRPLEFMPITEAMILVIGHPDGFHGHGTVIEGFAFQSARTDASSGGMGILSLRVRDLVIRSNRFEAGLTSAGDLRATSARIEHNHGDRLGVNCGFCLAGPGDYLMAGNRLVEGGLGGIYVSAAVQHLPFSLGAHAVTPIQDYQLPAAATVTAVIRNNEIRDHRRLPIGFGIRALALGPGSAHVIQDTRVLLQDNTLHDNTFGLIVDAGFPLTGAVRQGDMDVALQGNRISGNCQANLLVAFTRHTGAIGTTTNPYLLSSRYRLTLGGDLAWADAWFSHQTGWGNTLVVDGATIAPGSFSAFDPTRACP